MTWRSRMSIYRQRWRRWVNRGFTVAYMLIFAKSPPREKKESGFWSGFSTGLWEQAVPSQAQSEKPLLEVTSRSCGMNTKRDAWESFLETLDMSGLPNQAGEVEKPDKYDILLATWISALGDMDLNFSPPLALNENLEIAYQYIELLLDEHMRQKPPMPPMLIARMAIAFTLTCMEITDAMANEEDDDAPEAPAPAS